MKILIAEDDPISSIILRKALERLGHEVTIAHDGAEALLLFKENPVQLVISDWMMPEMDGLTLCKHIRDFSARSYTYFIILTARDSREDKMLAIQVGADDFLVKPLDTEELMVRLTAAVRMLDMHKHIERYAAEQEELSINLEKQNAQLADAMIYLEAANHRFSELFMGLPISCFTYDAEGRIHEWNRACEMMYGIPATESFERNVWNLISSTENVPALKDMVSRVFMGERFEGVECEDITRSGETRKILRSTFPLHGTEGQVLGAISANMDITVRLKLEHKIQEQLRLEQELNTRLHRQREELAQANARLAQLVVTDGLTGLKNHRHFRENLERATSFTSRHGIPFSVVMLDVDFFKGYNDTYGHPAGDDVLRSLAKILEDSVRTHDVVARYGGEEFSILLNAADIARSCEVAERIRKAIESYPWPKRQVTASFGVSTYLTGVLSPSEIMDQADKALYKSKALGRNQVTHYSTMQHEEQMQSAD